MLFHALQHPWVLIYQIVILYLKNGQWSFFLSTFSSLGLLYTFVNFHHLFCDAAIMAEKAWFCMPTKYQLLPNGQCKGHLWRSLSSRDCETPMKVWIWRKARITLQPIVPQPIEPQTSQVYLKSIFCHWWNTCISLVVMMLYLHHSSKWFYFVLCGNDKVSLMVSLTVSFPRLETFFFSTSTSDRKYQIQLTCSSPTYLILSFLALSQECASW